MMKFPHFSFNRILLAASVFLAASQMPQPALAQQAQIMEAPSAHGMAPGAPHMPHQDMDMHGGPMDIGGPVPPFLHGIDLTEAQQDKIFDIMHNLAPQMRERMKAAGKARKELHALAMSQDYDDAKAKALVDAVSRASADMMLMHIRTDRQILALLTPEQRKQLDERKNQHPKHP